MTQQTEEIHDYTGKEFVIAREFDAPRELVFEAWTNSVHLAEWSGPEGFTNPVCEWDARPGGKIYDVMRGPNGVEYPMGGELWTSAKPERVVFRCGPVNEDRGAAFRNRTCRDVNRHRRQNEDRRSLARRQGNPDSRRYIAGFERG